MEISQNVAVVLGEPRTLWKTLYEEHKELLESFGKFTLELGRIPEPTEYEPLTAVNERLGSAKRALRAFVQGGGAKGASWMNSNAIWHRATTRRQWAASSGKNSELLDGFWALMLQLGRLPDQRNLL